MNVKGETVSEFNLYGEITKIDEDKRMVFGYASTDAEDAQNEIVEWDATNDALDEYSQWRTVREMHRSDSAVGTAPVLKMDETGLFIGAKVIDESAWKKVKEGVYKGFSIGGRYLHREPNYDDLLDKTVWHVTKYKLNEISLVDRPCNPDATYSMVKINTEEFDIKEEMSKAKITAMEIVRKEKALSPSQFYAFPREKKLPIFDASHTRNAMARFNQTTDMTDAEKKNAKRKILAASKKFGIDVTQFKTAKVHGGDLMVDTKPLVKNEEEKTDVSKILTETKEPKEDVKEEVKETTDKKVEEEPKEEVAEKVDKIKYDALEKKFAELSEKMEKIEEDQKMEELLVKKLDTLFEKKNLVEKVDKAKELEKRHTGDLFFETLHGGDQ